MSALLTNFLKALLIGVCASAPLGPLGILCIQKTLSKGVPSGICIGLGAALCDTISAAIALFSLSYVNDLVTRNRIPVLIVGGVIILVIGLSIAFKNPVKNLRQPGNLTTRHHIQEVLQGLAMTASNPGALVLMLGLFTLIGVDMDAFTGPVGIVIMLACVFGGAMLWWIFLSSVIGIFRKRFRLRQLIGINRVAGIVIAAFGAFAIGEGIVELISKMPIVSL